MKTSSTNARVEAQHSTAQWQQHHLSLIGTRMQLSSSFNSFFCKTFALYVCVCVCLSKFSQKCQHEKYFHLSHSLLYFFKLDFLVFFFGAFARVDNRHINRFCVRSFNVAFSCVFQQPDLHSQTHTHHTHTHVCGGDDDVSEHATLVFSPILSLPK